MLLSIITRIIVDQNLYSFPQLINKDRTKMVIVQNLNDIKQGRHRHRFNTSGGAILENYSLHRATRRKVNTRSLDGSRKSGGAMPSNSKSGGAKAPPAPPSVSPL